MKGKRFKENQKKIKAKNTFITILLLIFIGIMIFSGIKIIDWLKENNANKSISESIKQDIIIDNSQTGINKYSIDFKSLKQKNSDTVGWLKVNGTEIEYPVVKTSDNDYYLTHSFDKSENSAGWVFMDYKNNVSLEDKNTVIYGHNRRDGSMFASLKNVLDSDWQNNKENLTIPFITENVKHEYQVFSVYQIEKEDYYITTSFATNKEYEEFLETVKSRSVKDFGVEVNSNDKILTLSTCSNDNNYRVVLHAKKVL